MLEQYGDILTVNEVQEILKINRKTVYRLIKSKKFFGKKIGKVYRCLLYTSKFFAAVECIFTYSYNILTNYHFFQLTVIFESIGGNFSYFVGGTFYFYCSWNEDVYKRQSLYNARASIRRCVSPPENIIAFL